MHRACDDDDAPYPVALYWADLIDVFPGRFISEIQAEIDRLPVGLLSEALEARSYRQAKQMREAAEQSSDPAGAIKRLPQTPMFGLVSEIDYELAHGKGAS